MYDSEDLLRRPLILDVQPPIDYTPVHDWPRGSNVGSPTDPKSAAMRVLTNRRMLMHIAAFQPSGVPMAVVVAREQKLEKERVRRKRYYWAAVSLGIAETVCMFTEAWLLLVILTCQQMHRSGMICLLITFGFTVLTGTMSWIRYNHMGIRMMAMQRKRRGKASNCCLLWIWLFCVPTWLSQQLMSEDTHPVVCLGYFCFAGPLQIAITTISEGLMWIMFILRVYVSPITNIVGIRNLSRRHNFAGGYPDLEIDPLVGTLFTSMLEVPFVNVVQIHPLAGVVQYFARSELNLRDFRIVVGALIHYTPLLLFSLALVAGRFENHQPWLGLPIELVAAITGLATLLCVIACIAIVVLQRQLFPSTLLRRSLRSFYPARV